jgi:hypothetical protein
MLQSTLVRSRYLRLRPVLNLLNANTAVCRNKLQLTPATKTLTLGMTRKCQLYSTTATVTAEAEPQMLQDIERQSTLPATDSKKLVKGK